jgi:hypothetical protein
VATTSTARVTTNGRGGFPATRVGTPLPTRQKRPGYVALAIVLIVGLAALGAYFYSKAGQKTPVVVVVKDVPAGHVISREDLSTVNVAGGVTALAGSHIDSVVGEVATVELLPNTLLQRSMVTDASPLPASSAMVGVELKPGQLPATGLSAGAQVQVLQLPNKTATAPAASGPQNATVLAGSATVYTTTPDPSQTGGTLATLIVPKADAAAIAAASSAGLVALIQVGQ